MARRIVSAASTIAPVSSAGSSRGAGPPGALFGAMLSASLTSLPA
jgi:hypothetical protein